MLKNTKRQDMSNEFILNLEYKAKFETRTQGISVFCMINYENEKIFKIFLFYDIKIRFEE